MTVTSPGSSWSFAVGLRDGATFDSPLPTVDVFAGGAAIALPVVITASGGSYSVEVDTATLPEDTLVFARVSGFIDGRYMEFASTTLMASVGTNLTELGKTWRFPAIVRRDGLLVDFDALPAPTTNPAGLAVTVTPVATGLYEIEVDTSALAAAATVEMTLAARVGDVPREKGCHTTIVSTTSPVMPPPKSRCHATCYTSDPCQPQEGVRCAAVLVCGDQAPGRFLSGHPFYATSAADGRVEWNLPQGFTYRFYYGEPRTTAKYVEQKIPATDEFYVGELTALPFRT